jgi:hypothetical protein
MLLSIKTLRRVWRAVTLAAVLVAASGMLEIAGRPLFATLGEVALNWAAVRSEAERLRQKITWALCRAQVQTVA